MESEFKYGDRVRVKGTLNTGKVIKIIQRTPRDNKLIKVEKIVVDLRGIIREYDNDDLTKEI